MSKVIQFVREIVAGKGAPTAADLEQILQRARAEVATAEAAHAQAQRTLDVKLLELAAAGDEAGIAALRRAVLTTAQQLQEAQHALGRFEQASTEARAAEASASVQSNWDKAESVSKQLIDDARALQAAGEQLVAALDRFQRTNTALLDALPDKPSYTDFSSVVFSPGIVSGLMQLHMNGVSDGRFMVRGLPFSPWQCRQRPDFVAQVRDSVSRALSMRPQGHQPDPPPKAA